MKILCPTKDYYDFLQGQLGIDELVIYDRRDYTPIDPIKITSLNLEPWFYNKPLYSDKKKTLVRKWASKKVLEYRRDKKDLEGGGLRKRRKKRNEEKLEGTIYHFILEVGYHHYFFEVERYLDDYDDSIVHLDCELVEKKDINKNDKISDAPMCIAPVEYTKHHWLFNDEDTFKITNTTKANKLDNPILLKTYITKFIKPEEIWNNLYEYISSLRDKEFEDTRTNDQHIESHGFDKKTSFRHRKKT